MNTDLYVNRIMEDAGCWYEYVFPDVETRNAVYEALDESTSIDIMTNEHENVLLCKNWDWDLAYATRKKDICKFHKYTDANGNDCIFYINDVCGMNSYRMKNAAIIINCTPHPVRFQDLTGEIITINNNSEYIINARVEEETVEDDGIIFTKPSFVSTPEGNSIINRIKEEFDSGYIIIGSIIAAQAYPGQVCGMCPIPGHERVAPAEKIMRVDKFTRY